jgi:hypothetical protein
VGKGALRAVPTILWPFDLVGTPSGAHSRVPLLCPPCDFSSLPAFLLHAMIL